MQIPETMFAWRKHKGNPNPVRALDTVARDLKANDSNVRD